MSQEVGTAVTENIDVVYGPNAEKYERDVEGTVREIASALQDWVNTARGRTGSMIDRVHYEPGENPLQHIAQAKHLLGTDDLIGAFAEFSEGVAIQGVKWELADEDTADLFNQMAAEQNLDDLLRKIWRNEFAVSQVVLGLWWDTGTFKIRGVTSGGNQRKSTKTVWYPRRITVLDDRRVVPVGLLAFGQERLAWCATPQEMAAFNAMLMGQYEDELMKRFYVSHYQPTYLEQQQLSALGVDVSRLILLNDECVRRHTLTRADHERFAPVRLRRTFRLIEMRQQLMEADRVALIGQANYILLVKKGDKDRPAQPAEMAGLREGFKTLARVPVIFSDHRLEIEIIAPAQDFVLHTEKYDLLDGRIVQTLLNTLTRHGSRSSSAAGADALGRPVAQILEGRRHMIRRFLERLLSREVANHPRNAKLNIDRAPSMVYIPGRIQLSDDAALATQVINLRNARDLSRDSALEFFGYDQEAEALRMDLESKLFDDIFKTAVPFSAAGGDAGGGDAGGDGAPPQAQGPAGGQGGRPQGGGKKPANVNKSGTAPSGQTTPTTTK